MTGRAEAQCVRLAVIYALLDQKTEIQAEHLSAALAVWKYCERSAELIFGRSLGNPLADEPLSALSAAGKDGLSQHPGHVSTQQVGRADRWRLAIG